MQWDCIESNGQECNHNTGFTSKPDAPHCFFRTLELMHSTRLDSTRWEYVDWATNNNDRNFLFPHDARCTLGTAYWPSVWISCFGSGCLDSEVYVGGRWKQRVSTGISVSSGQISTCMDGRMWLLVYVRVRVRVGVCVCRCVLQDTCSHIESYRVTYMYVYGVVPLALAITIH